MFLQIAEFEYSKTFFRAVWIIKDFLSKTALHFYCTYSKVFDSHHYMVPLNPEMGIL